MSTTFRYWQTLCAQGKHNYAILDDHTQECTDCGQRQIINMPRTCRFCGENINSSNGLQPITMHRQTVDDLRKLVRNATYVKCMSESAPYWTPIDCWIEHNATFLRYVWYKRVGNELVQMPYPDDNPSKGYMGVFGIFPLVAKEYAL